MQPIDAGDGCEWRPVQRQARWWEWLAILLLLLFAGGARATTVYKCTGADGVVAYQQQACSDGGEAVPVVLASAPARQPSPSYALAAAATAREDRTRPTRVARAEREPTAFECRGSDGQVFYRLNVCPRSVSADAARRRSTRADDAHRDGAHGGAASVTVSARRVPLDEACAAMRRAGAIGRSGSELDEAVSTYDRNLGRDPCR